MGLSWKQVLETCSVWPHGRLSSLHYYLGLVASADSSKPPTEPSQISPPHACKRLMGFFSSIHANPRTLCSRTLLYSLRPCMLRSKWAKLCLPLAADGNVDSSWQRFW